jgi:uncharacterized protein YecT (DUF1311 family)
MAKVAGKGSSMTRRVALCCAALLVLAARPVFAQSNAVRACLDGMTGAEQKQCTEAVYRAATAQLETLYRGAVDAALRPDVSGRAAAIAASQAAWEAYRDAECRGLVGLGGGSGRSVWVYGCLAEKTFERMRELKVPFDQR